MHLPVLNVAAEDIPERMLVVGDPDRALQVASRFEDGVEIGRFREYVTLVGRHRGVVMAISEIPQGRSSKFPTLGWWF